MSRANVELARRLYEWFNVKSGADRDEAHARGAEVYHQDVETLDLQPPPDMPAEVRGREAVIDNLLRWTELFDGWTVEIVEAVDAHPWVICDSRWKAVGRGSETPVEWRVTQAHEFGDDGKVVRDIYGFGSIEDAIAAVRAEGAGEPVRGV